MFPSVTELREALSILFYMDHGFMLVPCTSNILTTAIIIVLSFSLLFARLKPFVSGEEITRCYYGHENLRERAAVLRTG